MYQFKVVAITASVAGDVFERRLNEYGAEGFQVVHAFEADGRHIFVMQREVPDPLPSVVEVNTEPEVTVTKSRSSKKSG